MLDSGLLRQSMPFLCAPLESIYMSAQQITDGRIGFATSVYQQYARLMQGGAELGGKLLLVSGADGPDPGSPAAPSQDEALVRAANIAGAATLLLCPSSSGARAWVHAGVCDFLVTTLDEALRILKNELRRKLPAAVCLLADPAETVRECVARGLQPDLFTTRDSQAADGEVPASKVLVERGARLLSARDGAGNPCAASAWSLASWTAPGLETLPALDRLALGVIGAKQHAERCRWLLRAPQYLGRALGRGASTIHTAALELEEAIELAAMVAAAIREERLPPGVNLQYTGKDLLSGQPDSVCRL